MKPMHASIILLSCLAASCGQLSDEELWIRAETSKNNGNWDSTLQVCNRILDEYPDGGYAGWARFGIAESYRFKNMPREALDNYKLFYEQHPNMQPSAVSLFLIASIYHNNLLRSDSAIYYYQRFLQRYPNHDLAPTAKSELETVRQHPPELLKFAPSN
jgi:tetratricopeptide (TPR) repeat protein